MLPGQQGVATINPERLKVNNVISVNNKIIEIIMLFLFHNLYIKVPIMSKPVIKDKAVLT